VERSDRGSSLGGRRLQLAAAILGMVMIAPVQYSWTLFSEPLSEERAWSLAAVQVGFTVFVAFQAFTQPVSGGFIDRLGPRAPYAVGAVLVGVGWCVMGLVDTLALLYVAYAAAGVGAGVVYAGSVGVALRWYPDHRGLAVGLVTAGFGAGAAPFIPALDGLVAAYGASVGFVVSGLVIGVVLLGCASVLRHPSATVAADGTSHDPSSHQVAHGSRPRQYAPLEMVRTGRFWLVFFMYLAMATGGLLVTANLKPFATSLGIASGVVVAALAVAQIPNGLSRIVWGWVSDRLGRLQTMVVVFAANGLLLAALPFLGDVPVGLVVLTPLVMFTWGEAFALIPALTADTFGTDHAAANQGVMYMAKGVGGLLGGALAAWTAATFGWTVVFLAAAALALAAAGGALVLLVAAHSRRAA